MIQSGGLQWFGPLLSLKLPTFDVNALALRFTKKTLSPTMQTRYLMRLTFALLVEMAEYYNHAFGGLRIL